MSTVAQRPLFDTHASIKRLMAAGIPVEHAEAQVEVQAQALHAAFAEQGAKQREAVGQAVDATGAKTGLAIGQLRGELRETEQRLKGDLRAVEQQLQGDLRTVEQQLKADLRTVEQQLQGEIALLRKDMLALENRLILKLSAVMAALMGFFGLAMKLVDKLL